MEPGEANPAVRPVSLAHLYRLMASRMDAVGETPGVQFQSDPRLTFQSCEAVCSDAERDSATLKVALQFGSLMGASSPCPDYVLDLVSRRIFEEESEETVALLGFFEIFGGRLIQLLLASRFKHDYPAQAREDTADAISTLLLSLAGLGCPHWAESANLDRREMLRYTGLFSLWPRSAIGLEGLLTDYFDRIPFRVASNVLSWSRVRHEGRSDRRNSLGVKNSVVSENLILGEWLADYCNRFRIHVGPLSLADYLSFLPPGPSRRELAHLVKFYAPAHLAFDVVLHIQGKEIPPLILGEKEKPALGWTTWLVSLTRGDDAILFAVNEEVS